MDPQERYMEGQLGVASQGTWAPRSPIEYAPIYFDYPPQHPKMHQSRQRVWAALELHILLDARSRRIVAMASQSGISYNPELPTLTVYADWGTFQQDRSLALVSEPPCQAFAREKQISSRA